MEKSTKKKIWIGVAVATGIAAGVGTAYYKMKKNTMDASIPLDPNPPKKNPKGLKQVEDAHFMNELNEQEKQLVKKSWISKKGKAE